LGLRAVALKGGKKKKKKKPKKKKKKLWSEKTLERKNSGANRKFL